MTVVVCRNEAGVIWIENVQIPPDLVVKPQATDIVDIIL